MFTTADRQETNEWNLHACQRPKSIPSAVADIDSRAETSHTHQYKNVEWDQIGDEDISTPSRNHISVK